MNYGDNFTSQDRKKIGLAFCQPYYSIRTSGLFVSHRVINLTLVPCNQPLSNNSVVLDVLASDSYSEDSCIQGISTSKRLEFCS